MLTTMAIIKPIYLNASRDFGKWFAHNWRKLEDYFTALGGDKYDTQEYIAFCQCQFDQQQLNERDVKLLNVVDDQNARFAAQLELSRA